jgi:hypothetical protein
MSKNKPPKKKVVVTTTNKKESTTHKKTVSKKGNKKVNPTVSTRGKAKVASQPQQELIFHRQHYMTMGLGILLIILGMVLMSGGSMPSPDVWDEGRIYGFRRTVLAPILILAGLVVEIYAIFKK